MTGGAMRPVSLTESAGPPAATSFRPLSDAQCALLEASPYPMLVLDREFRIRFVNMEASEYGVVVPALLVGRNVWACYPALEGSVFHDAYQGVLDSGTATRFERYDAERDRWQAVVAYPADGGVVAKLEDITETKRAEFALRESEAAQRRALNALQRSEEVLRLAQEAANIGSFDVDLRTGLMTRSEQLLRLLALKPGVGHETLGLGAAIHDFVHAEDRDRIRREWSEIVSTGVGRTLRVRLIRADGVVRHVTSSLMLVRNEQGAPVRIVGTSIDVTEQLHAEEERQYVEAQIQHAQKLESLGVLAGGIAHDFNNLLVGILGNASLALLDLDPGTEARQSLAAIEESAQRAADLTRQLLAYAGKGRYVMERMNIAPIIEDMQSLMRSAMSRNASLRVDLTVPMPDVEVDISQFRQVMMNLVTNASDALGNASGTVTVHSGQQELSREFLATCVPGTNAAPGAFAYVAVRDTGSGMDDSTRRRMFEPFFSTKFTGRGLGLAATMGIVRSHRGTLCVESATGSGTSVTLFLPIANATQHEPASVRDGEWRGAGHILVVDDEDSVRAVATALLRRRGFEVTEAKDGSHAVELLRQHPADYALVLLDLTMPGMNGEATFRALREIRDDQRVLLMSGYNEQDVTRMFLGRGLAGFLQKPFRADELYARVADTLHAQSM